MKTQLRIVLAGLVAVFLMPSCTSGLHIEKRHHRDGYYISKSDPKTKHNAEGEVASRIESSSADTSAPASTSLDSEQHSDDSSVSEIQPLIEKPKTFIRKVDSVRKVFAEKIYPANDSLAQNKDQLGAYNGPADAKNLVAVQRIGFILLLAAAAAIGLAILLLALFWEGMILIPIAGILALISYGIHIAVMAIAMGKYKQYLNKDPESAEFYRRMKNRSLAVVIGVSILLLFAMFLWVVSITGPGF